VTSAPLRVRSFAKINLALAVLGKRADGYHEIQTVLQTIDLHDDLEFRLSPDLRLDCVGLEGLATEDNLVWRSATALKNALGETRGAEILLRKSIPVGAGLGGGSSNAASTLLGLCRLWTRELSSRELGSLARKLGSDVPFFLEGGTALGSGRGDEIQRLEDLPCACLVVVFPGFPVSTANAYRSLSFELTSPLKANKIRGFCDQMRSHTGCLARIFNDFETSILPAYPAIREAKDFLKQRGATATLLSGSGSAVFGFFDDEESTLAASRPAGRDEWRVFPAKTLSSADYFRRMFG